MKQYKHFFFDLDGTIYCNNVKKYQNQLLEDFVEIAKKELGKNFNEEKARGCFGDLHSFIAVSESADKTMEQLVFEHIAEELNIDFKLVSKIFKLLCKATKRYSKDYFDYNLISGVANAIKYLKDKGYNVYLTTNTYFPREIILNRLKWTGFKAKDFENYVPGWEDIGFVKPSPKYFEYFMKKFNLNPNEILMTGNDYLQDGGSVDAGIDLYIVTNDAIRIESKRNVTYEGTDEDYYSFITKNF